MAAIAGKPLQVLGTLSFSFDRSIAQKLEEYNQYIISISSAKFVFGFIAVDSG